MKRLFMSSPFSCTALAAFFAVCLTAQSFGQVFNQQRSVGGIAIDGNGAVAAATVEEGQRLAEMREKALADVPADLQAYTNLRAVSLKQLEAELAKCAAEGLAIPDEIKYLAGLQRVEYVFVYPETNDIVLAGPAEGWRIDALGSVVGATTGRPVVLLDDLMVALRTSKASRLEAISCSIDPTAEGIKRVRSVLSRMRTVEGRRPDERPIEEAMGPQVISVTGVPVTSHFAQVMVAADFRMKRLAMNFQQAPLDEMPSFMQLISTSRRAVKNMTPRWWLATNYEPLARDAEGLAWQLRGQGVRCLTEEDHFNAEGQRERSAKAGKLAQQWAQTLTDRYDELAEHDSAFGQLRNVMDLAVVAALIEMEQLFEVAGLEAPQMLATTKTDIYEAPKFVEAQASFIRQRGNWVVSASGGVQVMPWHVADRTEEVAEIGAIREQFASDSGQWYRQ